MCRRKPFYANDIEGLFVFAIANLHLQNYFVLVSLDFAGIDVSAFDDCP